MAIGARHSAPDAGPYAGDGTGGSIGGEPIDWLKLVAELAIDLGWTRDEVLDQVDMPFLAALMRAFADYPPLRKIAAAFAGYKRPKRSNDLSELLAMFPDGKIG